MQVSYSRLQLLFADQGPHTVQVADFHSEAHALSYPSQCQKPQAKYFFDIFCAEMLQQLYNTSSLFIVVTISIEKLSLWYEVRGVWFETNKRNNKLKKLNFIDLRALGYFAERTKVVKCKRVLDTANEALRHSLRSFVNHFQQKNLQGNLEFFRKRKPHIDKTPNSSRHGKSHVAKFVARFSASAIKGDIAYCQNSCCTQYFTWIHDVHAVNLHKSQYHTEKRPHTSTSKQLNIHSKCQMIKMSSGNWK